MNAYNSQFLIETRKSLISVENLTMGMYVCELDKPWKNSPFLFQGFLIDNEDLLNQVKRECQHVYIDIFRQRSIFPTFYTQETLNKQKKAPLKKRPTAFGNRNKPKQATDEFNTLKDIIDYEIQSDDITPPPKLKSFEEEINTAQRVHVRTFQAIRKCQHQIMQGKSVNSALTTNAVYECMRSILRTPDAMMLMTHLRDKNEFTWHHSLNVCVHAINLGRHLNLRYDELIILGMSGLMHDIGNLRIPKDILEHSATYTPEEREIMQSHTTLGRKILLESPSMSKVVAEVAHTHHERIDGTGFPLGLSGGQISPYAKMISIVDMYDSMTTQRPYKEAKTHLEAINTLIELSGDALDETLVNNFIQSIGVYPAGSLVETKSGDYGVVLEVNQNKKLQPKIMMLYDKEKKPLEKTIIDLSAKKYDLYDTPYTIKTIVNPNKIGLDISKIFKYGVIQKSIAMH